MTGPTPCGATHPPGHHLEHTQVCSAPAGHAGPHISVVVTHDNAVSMHWPQDPLAALRAHVDDETPCGWCGHDKGWHTPVTLDACNEGHDTPDECFCPGWQDPT